MAESQATGNAIQIGEMLDSPSEEFLKLSADRLLKLIHHRDAGTSSMDKLVQVLLQWTEAEDNREGDLLDILTTVDLTQMSSDLLIQLLQERVLVKQNPNILKLFTAEAASRSLVASSHGNKPKLLRFHFDDQHQRWMLRMFDIKKNQWSESKIAPFKWEFGIVVVWFGCYVYFICEGHVTPSARVLEYNPATNKVVSKGQLAVPVRLAGAGVFNKYIYVVNGRNEKRKNKHIVQRYDPIAGTCDLVGDTQTFHYYAHVLAFSDHLYVLGSLQVEKNCVERYDPEFNTWTKITDVPGNVSWCRATICSEKLFVVPKQGFKEFEIYDFAAWRWTHTKIEGSPEKIYGLYSTRLEGRETLLVHDGKGVIHYCDIETNQWTTKSEAEKGVWLTSENGW